MSFKFSNVSGNFEAVANYPKLNTWRLNKGYQTINSNLTINSNVDEISLELDGDINSVASEFIQNNPNLPKELKERISKCQTEGEIYETCIDYYYEEYHSKFGITREETIEILNSSNPEMKLIQIFNKNPKRLYYKVNMLPTTIYNYKDLSKIYKVYLRLIKNNYDINNNFIKDLSKLSKKKLDYMSVIQEITE